MHFQINMQLYTDNKMAKNQNDSMALGARSIFAAQNSISNYHLAELKKNDKS